MGQFKFSPIFGYGIGTNRFISENNLEPHNDYVRSLVEEGWVGFTTYIGFLLIAMAGWDWSSYNSEDASKDKPKILRLLGQR